MKKTLIAISLIASSQAFAENVNLTLEKIEPDNINWNSIPTHEVPLFFPGKITYSWLNSEEHKGTRHKNYATRSCMSCHQGEERGLGDLLVSRDVEEINSDNYRKNGSVVADMQFAHDDDYLYIRTSWYTQAERAGRMHNMYQWDGEKWHSYGYDRVRDPNNPLYEDRLSFMIDDGTVDQFAQQGCFMSCHQGERDLDPATREQTQALPVIGKGGLNKNDVRKYLPKSRTDGHSWDKPVSQNEVDQLKLLGEFVDLMQWRSTRSAGTGSADDGNVFEYRNTDSGQNIFAWNMDRKAGKPKYMYDVEVMGFYALDRADNEDMSKDIALIEGVNTMPYDESKIKPGQLIQGRLLRAAPTGSASDNFGNVISFFDTDTKRYTVIFKRKLDTGDTKQDKVMQDGGTYNFNVAIHDDSTTTRFHFVSFPFDLGIGSEAKGDIKSTRIVQ
ncbi:ethylbenzene dehydrogenase-related protein [Vibrio comitans]